jgi:hypothetical protein
MDHKDQRRVWFSYHAAVVLVISNSIRLFPGLLTPQSLAAQCVKAFRKTFVSQSGSNDFRDPEIEKSWVEIRYDPFDAGIAYAFVRGRWVECYGEHFAKFQGKSERMFGNTERQALGKPA